MEEIHRLLEHMAIALMQAEKFISGSIEHDNDEGYRVLRSVKSAIKEYEANMVPF